MNLLTVTCLRDKQDILRQAQSIQLYLQPCTHWIVINEEYPDESFWRSLLEPYYTRHTLKLFFSNWKYWKMNSLQHWRYKPKHPQGYKIQQVYKLLMSELIRDDYLIVDSDTFFIRPCSTDDWSDIVGSGRTLSFNSLNKQDRDSVFRWANKLNLKVPELFFDNCVPYVFNYNTLSTVPKFKKFVKWWNNQKGFQSEFFLYSILAYNNGLYDGITPQNNNLSRFYHGQSIEEFSVSKELNALLFKKEYFENVKNSREQVNRFLDSVGITQHY
jgi:hypothetical protein